MRIWQVYQHHVVKQIQYCTLFHRLFNSYLNEKSSKWAVTYICFLTLGTQSALHRCYLIHLLVKHQVQLGVQWLAQGHFDMVTLAGDGILNLLVGKQPLYSACIVHY